MRRRHQPKRETGLLLVMTPMTAGKWWFMLETPAQNHSASATALAPAIQSPARRQQRAVVAKCSLRAARKIVRSRTPRRARRTSARAIAAAPGAGDQRATRRAPRKPA